MSADFDRKSADFDQKSADSDRKSAGFDRKSADFVTAEDILEALMSVVDVYDGK